MKKSGINRYWDYVKRFWNFIWHDDSLLSYVLNFAFAFIVIKFMFFPAIGFVLNNDYPIVAIVSGSMEHKVVDGQICNAQIPTSKTLNVNFDSYWEYCGEYYETNFNLTKDVFYEFEYRNGLNIGDVMILYGKAPEKIEVGEVLVFVPENKAWFSSHGPVIHRVVDKWQDEDGKYYFQTKGDHNRDSANNFETNIAEEDVIGVSVLRIPFIGYAKIWMFNVIQGMGNLILGIAR